jgi:competence protein ComEC
MLPAPEPGTGLAPLGHPASVSDAGVAAMALAAIAGAWWAAPVPAVAVGAAAVAAAVVRRRARVWALVALALLGCSLLASRSLAGLSPPAPAAAAGWATLVADPVRHGAGVRVDVRLDGRRYELWLHGRPAGVVDELVTGDRFELTGRVRPPDADDLAWFKPRHVVGRLEVDAVSDVAEARAPWSWANAIRRVLERGLHDLDRRDRALALGFLVGDDRDLPPEVDLDLRAAGLSHLSAVSGQNIAFVLALAGPVHRRMGRRGRIVLTVSVLALFGFVTRWEPSVMRAATMAALASAAAFAGRPSPPVRNLMLAVIGLVTIDPLLIWSVGFRLSVAASLGIIVAARRIAGVVPGPRALADAVGVTTAAQLGVAPVLLATFGPMPLAALPANLAAGMAAGAAMMWGLPAGLVAGLVGHPWDGWLHLPTELLVSWVAFVARTAATTELPDLGPWQVAAVAAAGAVAVIGRQAAVRWSAVVAVVAVLGAAVLARPEEGAWRLDEVDVWRAGGATVVALDGPSPTALLSELRRLRVDHIDLLVVRSSSPRAMSAIVALESRHSVGRRVDPGVAPSAVVVGGLRVGLATQSGGRVAVTVDLAGGTPEPRLARTRGPPPRLSRSDAEDLGLGRSELLVGQHTTLMEAGQAFELGFQVVTALRGCGRGRLLGLHGGHLLLHLGHALLGLEGGLLGRLLVGRGLGFARLALFHSSDHGRGRAGDDGSPRHRPDQAGSSDPSPHDVFLLRSSPTRRATRSRPRRGRGHWPSPLRRRRTPRRAPA